MLMDLTVRTLQGSYSIRSLHPSLTVDELKRLLYETVREGGVHIPKPENQNLVHNGSSLDEEKSLKDMGIQSGDSLVLLDIPNVIKEEYPEPSEMPDIDAITKAITEYAKQNGLEGRLNTKEEPQTRRSQRFGYDHLRSILDSLEGGIVRQEALNDASRVSSEDAVESIEEPQPVQVPEPNAAHVQSLLGMGFGEELIRKALLLHRNRLEETLDWLLQHHEDPEAATPLTAEELSRIYGRRLRRRGREPDPELIAQIQEMGFTEQNAIGALRAFGNNIEVAISWLLQNQGQSPGLGSSAGHEDTEPESASEAHQQRVDVVEEEHEDFGDPDVRMAEAETGDEPESPQFPSAAMISDSRLGHIPEPDSAQGMVPDSDSEILSPFSPDGGAHEPLEAINVDEDSRAQADDNRLADSIDVETFEEANDVLGVDFREGELEGLDLEDVERLLSNGSEGTQAFNPRIRELVAMDGHGTGQLSDNFDVLINDWRISALDEVMHNSNLVDRLREVLNMLGAQGSNQGEEAGPSGENSGVNQ